MSLLTYLHRRRHGPKQARLKRSWKRAAAEIVAGTLIVSVFVLKVVNYSDPAALRLAEIVSVIDGSYQDALSAIENLPILNQCPHGLVMIDVPGGYVCVHGPNDSVYTHIYRSDPLVGGGRETIYASVDAGNMTSANDLLRGEFALPRYPPYKVPSLPTWAENPYNSQYARLEFYSLRPTLDLLYAFRASGKPVYARQLLRLDQSFFSAQGRSPWAWANPHAVAFRAMALVDTWWKLRQAHQLSESASTAILRDLEKTGQFLADPNQYQPGENDGTNEAAALYELAVAFPGLPHAHAWLALARQRFTWQLASMLDANGELIENSPYYQFYTLEKYWEVYQYSLANNAPISPLFARRLQEMLHFATYILEPNSQVPLLGSSLAEAIHYHGPYTAMAATNPQFLYVLTHGYAGSAPPDPSVYFPSSGLTIMRSGWGSGSAFPRSTYLTLNVGRYRTAHSNLDALGLTLYGDGGDLLPGPGLYTYNPGPYRNYFHGTVSHDTVVVDGRSQSQGNGTGQPLVARDGVTYQTAESLLYTGVVHRRLVMMIDPQHILVVDRLSSGTVHAYQQMWHLFPGARLAASGLTVTGAGGTPRREITISQLLPGGITESHAINQRGSHPDGLCSQQYGKALPCYAVSYLQRARNASYATLLTIGPLHQSGFAVRVSRGGQRLLITDGPRHLVVSLGQSAGTQPRAWATNPAPPPVTTYPVRAIAARGAWQAGGAGLVSSGRARDDIGSRMVSLAVPPQSSAFMQKNGVALNLLVHKLRLRLKVTGYNRVTLLHLLLSNNHWATSARLNLLDSYTRDFASQWHDVFIGPSRRWGYAQEWQAPPGFNWTRIDGMELQVDTGTAPGRATKVSVDGAELLPTQRQAKLVFIFDDGYQSILPAAAYMHHYGMPGNVAVIGKYAEFPASDHLNLFQLQALQDRWGWNMANHTQEHVDALQHYYRRNNLSGYSGDIVRQAIWLEAHGLNSAPNWLIYPHGATNATLERVVGRFYAFARVTADGPDAYPYGDPRAVSDMEVQFKGSGEGGSKANTPPAQVLAAVHQAVLHHYTIFLTFHRIHTLTDDPPGYPLALFEQIVNGIRRSGIKVMTLSQLDRSNGVSLRNRVRYVPGHPSQITVVLSQTTSGGSPHLPAVRYGGH